MGIPSSSFIPGTKVATLAVIGATRVNVMVAAMRATAELKSALLRGWTAALGRNAGQRRLGANVPAQVSSTAGADLIQELQACRGVKGFLASFCFSFFFFSTRVRAASIALASNAEPWRLPPA